MQRDFEFTQGMVVDAIYAFDNANPNVTAALKISN